MPTSKDTVRPQRAGWKQKTGKDAAPGNHGTPKLDKNLVQVSPAALPSQDLVDAKCFHGKGKGAVAVPLCLQEGRILLCPPPPLRFALPGSALPAGRFPRWLLPRAAGRNVPVPFSPAAQDSRWGRGLSLCQTGRSANLVREKPCFRPAAPSTPKVPISPCKYPPRQSCSYWEPSRNCFARRRALPTGWTGAPCHPLPCVTTRAHRAPHEPARRKHPRAKKQGKDSGGLRAFDVKILEVFPGSLRGRGEDFFLLQGIVLRCWLGAGMRHAAPTGVGTSRW